MISRRDCIDLGLQTASGGVWVFVVSVFLPGDLGLALRLGAGIAFGMGILILVASFLFWFRR